MPGWSGANQIPLTVSGATGSTISVNFTPLGNNMSCQLVYRATDGSVVYSQPVASGTCSLRLDKAVKNNVVVAVICNTDFIYNGESSRTTKYDYRLALGTGVSGTASINSQWFKTTPVPAGINAIGGNGEVALSWISTTGATSYTVKRATTSGGPYTNITTSSSTSYINTGLTNGTVYYYVVSATGSNGTSVDSNEVSAMPFTPAIIPANSGFEVPATSTYVYNPSGGSWTFTANGSAGGSGISTNGSTFTSGNYAAPQGTQAAMLQKSATIAQAVSGFTPGTTYTIKFLAAQRQNKSGGQAGETFELRLDDAALASFEPYQSRKTYAEFAATFTATSDTHTLSFVGTNTHTGDNTVFIDRVLILSPVPAITAIFNQTVAYGGSTGALAFTLTDADTPAASLTIDAASSNTAVVPLASIAVSGTGASRAVNVTPAAGGTSTITLTVSDGTYIATSAFTVTALDAGETWRRLYFGTTLNSGTAADRRILTTTDFAQHHGVFPRPESARHERAVNPPGVRSGGGQPLADL